MTPAQKQELGEIREMLAEHIADFRIFKTALMGTDQGEIKEGRLPRLEATVENHSKRLHRQERSQWLQHAVSILGGIILGIAAFVYYIHNIALRAFPLLERH